MVTQPAPCSALARVAALASPLRLVGLGVLIALLAACTSGSSGASAPTASAKPTASTAPAPASTAIPTPSAGKPGQPSDLMLIASTGQPLDIPEAQGLADSLGITLFEPTNAATDDGYIGVAPFGTRCVMSFSVKGADYNAGNITVVVQSRYDESFRSVASNLPLKKVKSHLAGFNGPCHAKTKEGTTV